MQEQSNLSNKEFYRLHGALTPARIEQMIELDERLAAFDSPTAHIQEALEQFPTEDFLSEILNRVHALAKNVRGKNQEEAQAIAEALDDIAQTTFDAADYGRDELNQALKALEAHND